MRSSGPGEIGLFASNHDRQPALRVTLEGPAQGP